MLPLTRNPTLPSSLLRAAAARTSITATAAAAAPLRRLTLSPRHSFHSSTPNMVVKAWFDVKYATGPGSGKGAPAPRSPPQAANTPHLHIHKDTHTRAR